MRVRKAEREEYRRMVLGIGEYAPPAVEKKPKEIVVEAPEFKKNSFGKQIFELCNKSGKTKAVIARELGVVPRTMNDWIEGRIPRKELFEEIERYFNYTFNPSPVCAHYKINEFMKENGFSFKDMVDLTGYPAGKFKYMASPKYLVSYEDAVELATKLGLDPGYFLAKDEQVKECVPIVNDINFVKNKKDEQVKECVPIVNDINFVENKEECSMDKEDLIDLEEKRLYIDDLSKIIEALPKMVFPVDEKKRLFCSLSRLRTKLEMEVIFSE